MCGYWLCFSPVKMFFGCLRNYDRVLPGTVTFHHLYVLLSSIFFFLFLSNFMQISMWPESDLAYSPPLSLSLSSLSLFSSPV